MSLVSYGSRELRPIRLFSLAAAAIAVCLLASPSAARAQDGWRYLPLSAGNSWTYHRQHPTIRFAPTTGRLDRDLGNGVYHLDDQALPVLGSGVWVGFAGDVLYVYNFEQRRWVRFVDFGAAVGATWQADLGIDGNRDLSITLRSRTDEVDSRALGRKIGDCVTLSVRRGNARTTETWTFAPLVGLIRWSVPTGGFDLIGDLAEAVIWGRRLGPIGFRTIADGLRSDFFPNGDELVLVINSAADLDRFWAQHAPGTAAPRVDFARNTVLVALAGGRFGPREVIIESVTWAFPYTSARVKVTERDATNVASAATTWPFAIAVTERKVTRVATEWDQQ